MCGPIPSTIFLAIRPPLHGRRKGRPPPQVQLHICSASMHFINAIPGVASVLSDQCSRHFHLTDAELLAHFNSSFPQTMPWQIYHLQKEMMSALILALSRKRPVLGSLLNVPQQRMRIWSLGKVLPGAHHQPIPPELRRPHLHHPRLCTMVSRWLQGSHAKSRPIWNSGRCRPCGGPGVHPTGGPKHQERCLRRH
jgi:hypothetical protein